ncbi:MAG: tetratricopeptide repeat protein, partial [Ktedonobacteraceae bacterium]
MDDALLRQRVYEITRGHALCVSIIGTLWLEQEEPPFTFVDFPKLQEKFNERALLEFVQKRLDERLGTPFRELTRYSVLLRSFDLPTLRAVFPEYFSGPDAIERFHQFIRYPYIEAIGNQHYAFHDLLRELQAIEVREQEPELWKRYHKRALEYLTQVAIFSPDWYYHAIAYNEEQGMSDWWNATQDLRHTGTAYLRALFQAAHDVTLKLTPISLAQRSLLLGRFYYSSYGSHLTTALESYEQALSLFRQVSSKLGEANVRKAMGNVQQFRDEREAALESYEQALSLFRQVGDRLGEANVLQAMGDVQQF